MELVTRIYNVLIDPHNHIVPLEKSEKEITYWRLILRLAALSHDMGHLPFSHTAEKTLLPNGGHEKMTLAIIRSPQLQEIWKGIGPHAEEDIAKLATGSGSSILSPWERLLSQVITEDNFGADRIDYLIRDGLYTGVGYGHFDYHQLIDTLRILPVKERLTLGVTASGVQSVESLWIARYMMYARVYRHPKVRIYSYHLQRFMQRYYQDKQMLNVANYLEHTDYTLLTALSEWAREGDYDASSLLKREPPFCEIPFKTASFEFLQKLKQNYDADLFIDEMPQKEICRTFPISDGEQILSSIEASPFLSQIPQGGEPFYLYAHPRIEQMIKKVLQDRHGFAE
ncbi:MAG TPA: HD domain-containing protein, partial [Waddliaceae bacterium]